MLVSFMWYLTVADCCKVVSVFLCVCVRERERDSAYASQSVSPLVDIIMCGMTLYCMMAADCCK